MIIGPHLSIAKGYYNAAKMASQIGANSFQFFTRNPRGGSAKALDKADIATCQKHLEEHKFGALLAHAPYTMNLCAEKPSTAAFAEQMLIEDLQRLEQLPCQLYNFHPGSHTGQGVEVGTTKIVDVLNRHNRGQWTTQILLETMAGKGTEIGRSFEEIKAIIDRLDFQDNIGVCLDTCHIYSAGYDIVNDLEGVIEHFDRVIGLSRLKAIHLNDSKMPFDSNKDRHETVGEGTIGLEALLNFITHPAIAHLPILLETPLNEDGHQREIALIKAQLAKR